MSDSNNRQGSSGDASAPRTAPPETQEDVNATKIAALTGGYIVAHAPWVHFAGPQGDDLVRCDAGEFIAVEISVTFEGSCALLTLLREPRGGRLSK